jgi:hypothetical protein
VILETAVGGFKRGGVGLSCVSHGRPRSFTITFNDRLAAHAVRVLTELSVCAFGRLSAISHWLGDDISRAWES